MNTILGRLITIFVCYVLILAGVFATTLYLTNQQADDSLVVNLSGRQRMLSQKMSKETLIYSRLQARGAESDLNAARQQVLSTMKVFEVTLFALKDGGAAPLDLNMLKFRDVPPAANDVIMKQLEKVVGLWTGIKENIEAVVKVESGEAGEAMDYVIGNNVELLQEMNAVVFLMQEDAERKVALMPKIQGIAVIIGILIILWGIIMLKKTVTDPLKKMIVAAESMSTGDLRNEIESSGLKEVADLSKSLNRMRISFQKMMDLLT